MNKFSNEKFLRNVLFLNFFFVLLILLSLSLSFYKIVRFSNENEIQNVNCKITTLNARNFSIDTAYGVKVIYEYLIKGQKYIVENGTFLISNKDLPLKEYQKLEKYFKNDDSLTLYYNSKSPSKGVLNFKLQIWETNRLIIEAIILFILLFTMVILKQKISKISYFDILRNLTSIILTYCLVLLFVQILFMGFHSVYKSWLLAIVFLLFMLLQLFSYFKSKSIKD